MIIKYILLYLKIRHTTKSQQTIIHMQVFVVGTIAGGILSMIFVAIPLFFLFVCYVYSPEYFSACSIIVFMCMEFFTFASLYAMVLVLPLYRKIIIENVKKLIGKLTFGLIKRHLFENISITPVQTIKLHMVRIDIHRRSIM